MEQFGIPERRYLAHDGTEISYWISRPDPSKDSGFTLMLANGIGISREVWQPFVNAFRDRFTLIFWDYRAFYRSQIPRSVQNLSIEDQGRDVEGILAQEGLSQVVMVGWSMGVQVSLESWRFAAHRLRGLILMNGTPGRTYETAFGLPGLSVWVPPVTRYLMKRHPHRLNQLKGTVFRRGLGPIMRATGVVSRDVNMSMLHVLLEEYARLDFSVYFHLLNALQHHDPQHLAQIHVPVLVLVGDRDNFTPPTAGKRLHGSLPKAELERLPLGTHYMILEYPEQIQQKIEQFISRRVKPQATAHPSP